MSRNEKENIVFYNNKINDKLNGVKRMTMSIDGNIIKVLDIKMNEYIFEICDSILAQLVFDNFKEREK